MRLKSGTIKTRHNEMEYPLGATPLSHDDLSELKYKHVTKRAQLDELEQANITIGLQWLSRKKKPDVLSDHFMRSLHKKLFDQVWKWAGRYRQVNTNIGIEHIYIGVEIHKLMKNTAYWIKYATYPANEIAVRFHHKLVYIHPFPNGNGRLSRIMADALLEKLLGKPAINWTAGLNLQNMNARRQQYIEALQAADKNNYDKLLKFIT